MAQEITPLQQLLELVNQWGMTSQQVASLLRVEAQTVQGWLRAASQTPNLDPSRAGINEEMMGIPGLINIRVQLERLLPQDTEKQALWLSKPNKEFDQLSPLDFARQGHEQLNWVSYYLTTVADAEIQKQASAT